jgi:hypothetical protein
MKFKALALACTLLAGNASASVLLDFTGVGNGASVNDFYNGGTDSMGNSGVNYGIHFSGGSVVYLNGNPVGRGDTAITFAPRYDVTGINFNASQSADDGRFQPVYFASGFVDMGFVDTTIDPACSTAADCASKGYFYRSIEQLMPQRIGAPIFLSAAPITGISPTDGLIGVGFQVTYFDDIQFVSASWGPTDPASVPTPAPFALLGAGAVALMAARRRV